MKVLKPTKGGHDGSSFREILDIWRERGICEVEDNINESNRMGEITPMYRQLFFDESQWVESRPWVNNVGDIMLYDQPILDKIHNGLNWNLALFANEVPHNPTGEKLFKHWQDKGYCTSWTFWPNHPKEHEKVRSEGIPSYSEREFVSCFIGTHTTHFRNQSNDWGKYIQNYWMGPMNARRMSQNEYLNFIKKHKFGLCLRGVGPKCLRDVELIGMGTVPIFTPGVSTDYYNPLERDKHYLYAESPDDIPSLIANCSKEKWEYMSSQCIKWFNDNSSPEGVYKVTCKIINDFYDKNLV